MQQTFCTNCGQPLAPGAAFCANCGTRVEAPQAGLTAAPNTGPAGGSGYAPGYNPPASFAPATPQSAPPAQPKSRTAQIVGWVGGCLVAFLIVVALLIAALVYGIVQHQLVFFFIGLIGLVVIILVGVAIEHLIRRLFRRFASTVPGLERPGLERPGYSGSRYQSSARRRQEQRGFRPFRFLFTLVLLAAAAYGGLFLYDTQAFAGNWSGVLSIGTAKQGVMTTLPVSLSLHSPGRLSLSDPGSSDFTTVTFKPTTAQLCAKNGSPTSYQLSGTASRLDAAQVAMTLTSSQGSLQLQGSYQNGQFTLTGTSQGKPVTLTLQKGAAPAYTALCG